jgi:hypothetical protein
LKNATIEPLNLPQEKLDELKTLLQDSNLSDYQKNNMKRRISGISSKCGQMATQIA